MSVDGVGSVVAERRKKRYSQTRWVVTLVVIGLHLGASTKLVVSSDLNDIVANRLFGLAMLTVALAILVSLFWQETAAARGLRKRWTKRRVVVLLVIGCPLLTGSIWSMINSGTLMGQLVGQTTGLAALLIVGWSSTTPQRQ